MITFEWPWAIFLLPLPLIMRALLPAVKVERAAALKTPFYSQLTHIHQFESKTHKPSALKLFIASIIWLLIIIACARPMWIGDPVQLPSKGRDLMLAIDVSPSMETDDLSLNGERVTRLTVLKSIVEDFIDRRTGDRLGLIIFGSKAYLQAPLTLDRNTLISFLNESQTGIAGKSTAIGDAIGLSLKRLLQSPSEQKVLILVTDGENNSGEIDPIKAAELAAEKNLTIYTVGIGADEMVVPGILFGSRKINPSRDLDEKTLQAIADLSNGQYFRARSSQDLEDIYLKLDELEPVAGEEETYRPKKTLYFWPLGIAWLMSLLLALSFYPFPFSKAAT